MSDAPLDYRFPRRRMVQTQLRARGIADQAVLRAMGEVPRHAFVPAALAAFAYNDTPLPIGHGQTISQPFIVALMCELLAPGPGLSVLEIGTGSGYHAAVLHAMGLTVFTVERLPALYRETRRLFSRLGLHTVRGRLADGTLGWPEMGPFDRILVTAGGPEVPETLLRQLADPGILVMPVGEKRGSQRLVQVEKRRGRLETRYRGEVAFVDLVGDHGWAEAAELPPFLR
jgi:protein-L-isoaspartate(D-aspartate) O-methyltransferase